MLNFLTHILTFSNKCFMIIETLFNKRITIIYTKRLDVLTYNNFKRRVYIIATTISTAKNCCLHSGSSAKEWIKNYITTLGKHVD